MKCSLIKISFAAYILYLFSCLGCKYNAYGLEEFLYRSGTVNDRARSLKELKGTDIPNVLTNKYNVLVLADVHCGAETLKGNGPRKDEVFFRWLNDFITNNPPDEKPVFCICLGDIVEHGFEREYKYFKEFTDRIEAKGIKVFNAVGNHDLYNSGWRHFKKMLYPYEAFYKFKIANFSYYIIDSASGSLGNRQLTTLRKDMEKDPNAKIVCAHIPLYADGHFYFVMQNSVERNILISTFAKNEVKAFLGGHTHKQSISNLGEFTEYCYPGFYAKTGWGIITVDNTNKTITNRYIYQD